MKLTILEGDVFKRLPELPDNSIDLCVTSPPYWGLRSYGAGEAELGCEPTMEKYLDNTLRWVKEVHRVLKPTGSFVLNIGDCFIEGKQLLAVSHFAYCRIVSETDLVCRGVHVWAKPNVPSPIRSRLKHSHEYLYWFVKDADEYYFDEKPWMKKCQLSMEERMRSPATLKMPDYSDVNRRRTLSVKERNATYNSGDDDQSATPGKRGCGMTNTETIEHSWRIVPVGEKQNGFEMEGKRPQSQHVAPYPTKLIRPYVLSLCPPDGTVLDPFLGSGTTMRVAMEAHRSAVGIELNPEYAAYAKKRLNWGHGLGVEYSEGVQC